MRSAALLLAPVLAILASASPSHAAPEWTERSLTLPRHVFAADLGLGIGHARFGSRDFAGPGLNLEGAFAVTDTVELGLRTGVRLGDDARATGADAYGRTLWTETYGVNSSALANPEFRVRWGAYRGRVVEVGLDGRAYLPLEDGSRFGVMFGVPLAFHIGRAVRIDTGAYLPVVFDRTYLAFTVPGYFWFRTSDRVWLGPMTALRWIDPTLAPSRTDLLLGFGLGVQVSSAVDLKTQFFFPQVNDGARSFGAGFGVQLRLE